MTPLITAEALRTALDAGEPIRLLDVRWRLDAPDGRGAYLEGHLPGAVYVSLDEDLSDHGREGLGRHPLPGRDAFEATVRGWGVELDSPVVAYDDAAGPPAARAWWLLRAFGFTNARVLDGGLGAWTAAGGALETDVPAIAPSRVVLAEPLDRGLTADEAAAIASRGVLIDARPADRYEGRNEVIDPRAGHIPGAISLPTSGTVDAEGRYLDAAALRERFAGALGAAEVGVYCGSGVAATQTILALEIAGCAARLFPGSFSQWSRDPDRPIATGPDPMGDAP